MSSEKYVLVLGVDASGKSTFLKGLKNTLGFSVLEPTSSPEAKAFKAAHLDESLDLDLINERQRLFNDLNVSFDQKIAEERERSKVAATGSSLVTNLSHAVMRRVIREDSPSNLQVINEWEDSDSLRPDQVVLMHAPIDVIRRRIVHRQRTGVVGEKLIGFNSLYFLQHYQEALEETVTAISSDYSTASFDSSVSFPKSILDSYTKL